MNINETNFCFLSVNYIIWQNNCLSWLHSCLRQPLFTIQLITYGYNQTLTNLFVNYSASVWNQNTDVKWYLCIKMVQNLPSSSTRASDSELSSEPIFASAEERQRHLKAKTHIQQHVKQIFATWAWTRVR